MFESKLNRGRANGYAPLDSSGKVPLDKLPPTPTPVDTGSFATTGSNIFTGEQTISTIQGTGSLYLKPDSNDLRYFKIYNTNPSDTHIKANGGLSFFGDDTNYLKIEDSLNEVTLRASSTIVLETGGGDIIFNPDSGLYKGSANEGNALVTDTTLSNIIGDTSIINSSTGNTITDVIGRIQTVDSSSFATTGSNHFSGSQTITGSLTLSDKITFTNTASIQLTSTLAIAAPSAGIPNSVSNWSGGGGWNQMFYSNVTTTGGTGTGLTVDVAAGSGGYIGIEAISINTPGSGYTNGDIITIDNENNLPGTFAIGTAVGDSWTFDTNGSLTTPGDINVNGRLNIITPDPATDFTTIDFRNIDDFGIYGKTNSINARGNTLEFTATDYNINGDVVTHEVLTLRPEGNVGIRTNNPSNTLEVNGGVTATSFTGSLQGTASSALNTQLFDGKDITEFGTKVTGSWTILPGTFNYSITLDSNSTYQMWILGNIPNGIVKYNANVTISNVNVPVLGTHSAWNYVEGGSPILITSIPRQIVGVDGTISTSNPGGLGSNTNIFSFEIQNNTTGSVAVNYGYVKLS